MFVSVTSMFVLAFVTSCLSVTIPIPTGDLWFLKPNDVVLFDQAWKSCNDMKGNQLEIHTKAGLEAAVEAMKAYPPTDSPQEAAVAIRSVWTGAVKQTDGSYQWNRSVSAVDFKVMEWDEEMNKQPCEEDCCRVVLQDNGKAFSVSCKSTQVRARALCELYPMTTLKENFEVLDRMIKSESEKRQQLENQIWDEMKVHEQMIKSESQERQQLQTQIWNAMNDVNETVNVMDETVESLKSKSDVHGKDLKSASTDKTTLYVLFSINIVALLGLGVVVFVIWRRVNNNQ